MAEKVKIVKGPYLYFSSSKLISSTRTTPSIEASDALPWALKAAATNHNAQLTSLFQFLSTRTPESEIFCILKETS